MLFSDNKKVAVNNYIYILAPALVLSFLGLMVLFSAAGSFSPWADKQAYTFVIIIPMVFIISLINPNFFFKYAYVFYFMCFILLLIAEIMGHTAMGAQRWLRLGPINLQPSEFMKIAVILGLARYFHLVHTNSISYISILLIPTALILLPVALVLKQPNLGTASIIIMISGAIYFGAGVRAWKFIVIIITGLVSLPIIWNFMHDYQKQRVMTFLNPEKDPLGTGYNIIQSEIAIGSGEIFGKGFMQGTQNQLSFLPEKQTDFIFALLSEQFGFVGVVLTLFLYIFLIFSIYRVAFGCYHQFGRLICVGVATMIFVHLFINLGMISGILPVVGTPLPFLSFGRSNLLSSFIGIALVLNSNNYNTTKVH